jgi:hypothetical protein
MGTCMVCMHRPPADNVEGTVRKSGKIARALTLIPLYMHRDSSEASREKAKKVARPVHPQRNPGYAYMRIESQRKINKAERRLLTQGCTVRRQMYPINSLNLNL